MDYRSTGLGSLGLVVWLQFVNRPVVKHRAFASTACKLCYERTKVN